MTRRHTGFSRLAERSLNLLSDHPAFKLAALLWMAGASIAAPLYVVHKDRQDAARAGLLDSPNVALRFPGDRCVLINEGPRALAEATLVFNTYVVNASICSITAALTSSHINPSAASRDLAARDRLTAEYDRALLAERCELTRGPHACPQDNDCRLVIVCEAQFHRPANLEAFRENAMTLSSQDCAQLRDVGTLYTYSLDARAPGLSRRDPSDEQAMRCFTRSRLAFDRLFGQHGVIRELADKAAATTVDEK